MIILGWLFNFRALQPLYCQTNKYIAWADNIDSILLTGKMTPNELEQLIGRLCHLGGAIPMIHHFLSCLRDFFFCLKHCQSIALMGSCRNDLRLMRQMLETAKNGVNLNMVAYLAPTHVYYSDLCPAGLGGYSRDGFAWHFYLPLNLHF